MSTLEHVDESSSSKIKIPAEIQKKFWRTVQVALLCVVIFGILSLFSLPIIFYCLPTSEISSNTSGSTNGIDGDCIRSVPLQYTTTNGICLREFTNHLISSNCSRDPEGNVLIVRNEEAMATTLINGFKTIQENDECISKAVPFLCLHLFGLCGGSGVSIQPTTGQCEEIRDILCPQEWVLAQRLGIDLPDCAIFPAEAPSCPALNDSLSTNGTVTTNISGLAPNYSNVTTAAVLECTEGFYRENGSSVCIPSCYTWTLYSKEVSISNDVINFISVFIGIVAAIAVIIISCLARKRMFIFPVIFIIYMNIGLLVLGFLIMVGFMDRNKLFCSSRNLIESFGEVTHFCIVSGISSLYLLCQLTLLWLFHIVTLFWKVFFPFHAHAFEVSGKNKYIHTICVIVGSLLPLVPIITIMADTAVDLHKENENSTSLLRNSRFLSGGLGFGPVAFPPILCTGTNADAVFYSLILIAVVSMASGNSLLVIIFWAVHQLYIRRKQEQKNKANEKSRHLFTFGTAEKKLLIMFCYYVVTGAVILMTYIFYTRNARIFEDRIPKYFLCEQEGYDRSNPCNRSDIQDLKILLLSTLSTILVFLFPVVTLVYALNIEEQKEMWRKCPGALT